MSDDLFVPRAGVPPPPVSEIGGKGHALARLAAIAPRAGFEVPSFAVVRSSVLERLAREETGAPAVPAALRQAVVEALHEAGLEGARLAVRSSAADEDGSLASFAGQFETVLGVTGAGDALWDALRRVWASASSAHATAYRARRAGGDGVSMAVVLQAMVDAVAAGVAFSADPVSGERDTAVVSAVYGLGEGLVSGDFDADTFRVRFAGGEPAVTRQIAHKPEAIRMTAGGTARVPVDEPKRDAPAITDTEAIAIARCTRALAEAFGGPQDVEWALTGETRRLIVLQSRPITALGARPAPPGAPASAAAAAPAGERLIWDNSNIVESYSGVTTPLTFAFARQAYEQAYRQFCRLMGVSDALIESHEAVFANMLGLVRGRVYYHLLNWYRTLALLPGFAWNRDFMERMMGVRERLEEPPPPPHAATRLQDLWRLVRMLLRMIGELRKLKREVPAFHARVESQLAPLAGEDFSKRAPADLIALYRHLERELLGHWRAPLVNDFFAMIFFGVLCHAIEKWLPDAPPTLANDLLCGEGGIISTEPARRVMAMARTVAGTPELSATVAGTTDDAALWRRLHGEPALAGFAAELDAYVARFGDRCMNELKLETVTLGEDPGFLLQMIRAYAGQGQVDPDAALARERQIRGSAEVATLGRLRGWKRWVFLRVLRQARARVRDRENLRFERTRVFGVVRRIFIALGAHLAGAGRIGSAREVFWLTPAELFAAFEGGGPTDLAGLIRERRERFARYEREGAPPDRFETRGAVRDPMEIDYRGQAAASAAAAAGADLKGLGCCPGVVRARVRIVHDPRHAGSLAGHILVAERTDPGWTLLFPAACGLLVQRGSLLSHSAIVAREMGLPCVVGIPGLLDTLRDDEEVEMDGTAGVVRRLGDAA